MDVDEEIVAGVRWSEQPRAQGAVPAGHPEVLDVGHRRARRAPARLAIRLAFGLDVLLALILERPRDAAYEGQVLRIAAHARLE